MSSVLALHRFSVHHTLRVLFFLRSGCLIYILDSHLFLGKSHAPIWKVIPRWLKLQHKQWGPFSITLEIIVYWSTWLVGTLILARLFTSALTIRKLLPNADGTSGPWDPWGQYQFVYGKASQVINRSQQSSRYQIKRPYSVCPIIWQNW